MRRTALLTFFVLFAFCLSFAQGSLRIMESLVMPSRILNQDVRFSVCLPVDYYDETRSYPVVYLLHGLGDDETAWLEYGRISQYADWATEKDGVVPMIFIMPEGYTNYYVNDYKGSFLYQDMFVNELVPYIDSLFRTLADRQHRGLMGYSMGGFGALVLHLKHPEVFGSAVPLSISVRTDEQYKVEYAPEWDEQWGRLFGAQGIVGDGRITDYYRQNSPFHIIAGLTPGEMKNFNLYIDNGDKEQTLCRSNEELHILMHQVGFPHQFRVREGGHSFEYWCSALPNALRFLSDAFEGKPYRGDLIQVPGPFVVSENELKTLIVNNEKIFASVPAEYELTDRLYPVLYFAGNFSLSDCLAISESVNMGIEKNEISPMLVVFIPEKLLNQFTTILPEIEEKLRIRKGYRFRALAGYQGTADKVCEIVMNREQFSSCLLMDSYIQKESISGMLSAMKPDALKRTPFFIAAPDNGLYVEGNGNLHMIMRDMDLKHEYRVIEGNGGLDDWMIGGFDGLWFGGFEEMIMFVATNFHR
jgi:enterochelin esterase-like enzyme